MTAPTNPLLDAALAYAARGWRVFPANPTDRHPFVKWGLQATTNPGVIRQWWHYRPRALVCIATGPSGLAVADLDVKHGADGPGRFAELERTYGAAPRTLTQTTPSGGQHLIFAGQIKTTRGVIGRTPGEKASPIDTRGVGGMIVAAPSAGYTMHEDAELGDVLDPAALPEWLADLAGRIANTSAADQDAAVELDTDAAVEWAIHFLTHDAKPSIEGGEGEFALLMTAAVLKDHGISRDKAIELLAEFYNVEGKCVPLWNVGDGETKDRLDIKVQNAWLYLRQNRPGELSPQAIWNEPEEDLPPGLSGGYTREQIRRKYEDGEQPTPAERAAMKRRKEKL